MKKFISQKKFDKLLNTLLVAKWKHSNYSFESHSLITDEILDYYLRKFWNDQFKNVEKDVYFNIIFKCFINNFDGFRSISPKYRVCKEDYDKTLAFCKQCWSIQSE